MKNKKLINILLIVMAIAIAVIIIRDFAVNKKGKNIENPYAFDISEYTKVNPSEILYSEIKTIALNVSVPKGITVWEDKIILVAENILLQLNKTGEQLSKTILTSSPTCVTTSPSGNIWVGFRDKVSEYDKTGNQIQSWPSFNDRSVITSLAVSTDFVYVADAGNRVIYKCSKEGEILSRIGEKDEKKAIPGYVIPSPYFDVDLSEEGYLWAVNPGRHSFENYTNDGAIRSSWKKSSVKTEGFCGCCNPSHMAIMDDNSFVTSEKGILRIKIYDQHGEYKGVVAAPDQFDDDSLPSEVAVDNDGLIYVLDFKRKQIRVFQLKENG